MPRISQRLPLKNSGMWFPMQIKTVSYKYCWSVSKPSLCPLSHLEIVNKRVEHLGWSLLKGISRLYPVKPSPPLPKQLCSSLSEVCPKDSKFSDPRLPKLEQQLLLTQRNKEPSNFVLLKTVYFKLKGTDVQCCKKPHICGFGWQTV